MNKTFALLAPVTLLTVPALAEPANRPAACSKQFVSQWINDREMAFRNLPKAPCTMQGETGIYVCDKNGCQRPKRT